MNRTNNAYWILTGLLTVSSIGNSALDISHAPEAVAMITHLGYPSYFIAFIGIVRLLGIIIVLTRGYTWIKEWAYAGLFFDKASALFSHIATGDTIEIFAPTLIGLILVICTYIFYRRKRSNAMLLFQRN